MSRARKFLWILVAALLVPALGLLALRSLLPAQYHALGYGLQRYFDADSQAEVPAVYSSDDTPVVGADGAVASAADAASIAVDAAARPMLGPNAQALVHEIVPAPLQPGVQYRGRYSLFDAPWQGVPAPRAVRPDEELEADESSEEQADEPSEDTQSEQPPGACNPGLAAAGFQALQKRRYFALPWVESGDLVQIEAEYRGGLLPRAFELTVSGPRRDSGESSDPKTREDHSRDGSRRSLAFRAPHSGNYLLTLDLDACVPKQDAPFAIRVERNGRDGKPAATGEASARELPALALDRLRFGQVYTNPPQRRNDEASLRAPLLRKEDEFRQYALIGPLQAGKHYVIEAASREFDPYLEVYGNGLSSLGRLASDDDGGEDNNALLVFAPPQDGDYVIGVSSRGSLDPGRARSMRLELRVGDWK